MSVKSAPSRALFSLLAFALMLVGVTAPISSANAAPAPVKVAPAVAPSALAGEPLSCVNTIYATNSGANGTGTLLAINTSTGESSEVPIAGGKVGDNSLAMSSDGRFTYSYRNNASARYPIVVHDVVAGTLQEFPTDLGARTIRGAVNPVNGLLYISSGGADGNVYVFDTTTNTLVGKVGALSPDVTPVAGNGDFAFDSTGTLYITAGERLYRATSAVPTTAGNATISMTTIAVLPAGTNSPAIAFANDGYLYVSSGSTVTRVDPGSGQTAGSFTLANGYAPSDFASCASPNTLSLQKNVQNRILPTDQFNLQITGSGINSGNTATTTGNTNGVQAQVAGPVLALQDRSYTVSETASGTTNLANYVSTYQCVNVNNNNAVVASGSGTTATFTYPVPASADGANVKCTFTNTAKP